jgi:hypothetical protein
MRRVSKPPFASAGATKSSTGIVEVWFRGATAHVTCGAAEDGLVFHVSPVSVHKLSVTNCAV